MGEGRPQPVEFTVEFTVDYSRHLHHSHHTVDADPRHSSHDHRCRYAGIMRLPMAALHEAFLARGWQREAERPRVAQVWFLFS